MPVSQSHSMTYAELIQRYPHDPREIFKFGGQAVIFKSYDNVLRRPVAIKRAEVKSGNEKYSIFTEFELGQTLHHKNLAEYYDVFRVYTDMGYFDYGIMEFIEDGTNLDDFLKTFPDESTLQSVLVEILHGLSYLHKNNIIHRDLKPNNILIKYINGQPIPKIIDFGVSKALTSSDVRASSNVVGTAEYMAPEQLRGRIFPNSDLWTFGVIVFRMFTGEAPFGAVADGHSPDHIQNLVLDGHVPQIYSEVPEPYKTIIDQCLVADPAQRIQTVAEVLQLLTTKKYSSKLMKPFSRSREDVAEQETALENVVHHKSSANSWPWWVIILIILSLLGGSAYLFEWFG